MLPHANNKKIAGLIVALILVLQDHYIGPQ